MGQFAPTRELVCAAAGEEPPALLGSVTARFDPWLSVLLKRPGDERLERFAPFTAACRPMDGKSAFYRCENGSCSLPIAEE